MTTAIDLNQIMEEAKAAARTETDALVDKIAELNATNAADKENTLERSAQAYDRIYTYVFKESGLWQSTYAQKYEEHRTRLIAELTEEIEMASSARVTVTATPVRLDIAGQDNVAGKRIVIKNTNSTATNTVSLGGSGVTTANGFQLAGGAQIELPLGQDEQLWAVRDGAADPVVHVLSLS